MLEKRIIIPIFLFVSLSVLLVGCKKQDENISIITYRRIVVSGPTMYTEILLDLQAKDRIVGVADSKNNPPEVENLPKIGTTLHPNLEIIMALKPDIVVGAYGELSQRLKQLKIPVYLAGKDSLGYIDSTIELYDAIRDLSRIVYGNSSQAEIIIHRIKTNITKIEKKLEKATPVKVAVVYFFPNMPPYVQGKGTLAHELLERAYGYNVFQENGLYQISLEQLLEKDPEIIFTDPSQKNLIIQDMRLMTLQAVAQSKVFGIPASQWTSSRIDQTFKTIAQCMHPMKMNEN